MRVEPSGVYRSPLEEQRFGIRVARVAWMTQELLPVALDFARQHEISLLIARCMAAERRVYQAMEREGFLLTETMMCLEADVTRPIPPDPGKALVRPVTADDADEVARLAEVCFRGYESHYHADDRLERRKCDEIQVDWARRACASREVADEVLVAETDGALGGYFILKQNSAEEADVAVAAVVPDRRGRGVYESLVVRSMNWAKERGAKRITGLVQVTNPAVQRTPMRLGWMPSFTYHTFHKWFDRS